MTRKSQDRLMTTLTGMGLPPERAERKVQSIGRGWAFVVLGFLCVAAAFGLVIWIAVATKGTPGVALLVFASLLAVPGAYFLIAGGHIISGDAMRAAEQSGDALTRAAARALRLARGQTDGDA